MMKKLFAAFLCTCMAAATYAQTDTLNRTDKYGKKYGYWKVFDNSKKLVYEGRFYNGEPIGKMTHYHTNGKVKGVSMYTLNSPKVTSTLYHENGKISAEGIYINKKKDGVWKYYDKAGKLISEENYVGCKKNGAFRMYSPKNGVILEEVNWKNDKKEGLAFNNFSDGKLRLKMYYKNNKMDGPFENYYENGKVWTKGNYKEDFRDGIWTTFNEKGQELIIQTIEKGRATDILLGFNSRGQWIKLNTKAIAYFYQAPTEIIIVLKNKKTIPVQNHDLIEISQRGGAERFTFINENVLSSYTSIKKVTPVDTKDEEAVILLKPDTPFEVICDGDYYKMLKTLINEDAPKLE